MTAGIVYPGTFDPITNGHTDLLRRASRLFDPIYFAVALRNDKSPLLPHQARVQLAMEVLAAENLGHIQVIGFDGLLVDLMKKLDVSAILRGLRAVSDFEYEFQMASANRRLSASAETVFLTPAEEHAFISSSLVREVARFGGDTRAFVHPMVSDALANAFNA